ncbi:MAG: hypothetical protein WBV73_24385 [Phormidium sp.]
MLTQGSDRCPLNQKPKPCRYFYRFHRRSSEIPQKFLRNSIQDTNRKI